MVRKYSEILNNYQLLIDDFDCEGILCVEFDIKNARQRSTYHFNFSTEILN